MTTTEELVLTYWRSWQGSEPDWDTMRACLADEIDVEQGTMTGDQLTEMASNGTPWRDVQLIDSLFAGDRGAILYEGTNTETEVAIRIAEFLTVTDGKITRMRAAIPADAFP